MSAGEKKIHSDGTIEKKNNIHRAAQWQGYQKPCESCEAECSGRLDSRCCSHKCRYSNQVGMVTDLKSGVYDCNQTSFFVLYKNIPFNIERGNIISLLFSCPSWHALEKNKCQCPRTARRKSPTTFEPNQETKTIILWPH